MGVNALPYKEKREVNHASILYEMPDQEGDERRQGHNHEERETGNSRCVPRMWDEDVQDWKELRASVIYNKRAGMKPPALFYA